MMNRLIAASLIVVISCVVWLAVPQSVHAADSETQSEPSEEIEAPTDALDVAHSGSRSLLTMSCGTPDPNYSWVYFVRGRPYGIRSDGEAGPTRIMWGINRFEVPLSGPVTATLMAVGFSVIVLGGIGAIMHGGKRRQPPANHSAGKP